MRIVKKRETVRISIIVILVWYEIDEDDRIVRVLLKLCSFEGCSIELYKSVYLEFRGAKSSGELDQTLGRVVALNPIEVLYSVECKAGFCSLKSDLRFSNARSNPSICKCNFYLLNLNMLTNHVYSQ